MKHMPFIKTIQTFLVNTFRKINSNKYLSVLLTVLSLVYPLFLLALSWDEIKQIERVNFQPLLLAIGLYLLSSIIQLLNWVLILKNNLKDIHNDIHIYYLSILMQRLPGGFWQWVGRVNMYNHSTDISSSKTMSASIYERILLIISGVGCFLFFIAPWAGILASILFYCLMLFLRKANQDNKLRFCLLPIIHYLSYFICWLLGGIVLANIVQAIDLVQIFSLTKAFYVWSITGVITLIFFFLPGGLGIRELSLTTLMTPELTIPQAILAALSLRMFFLLMDIILGFGGSLVFKRKE